MVSKGEEKGAEQLEVLNLTIGIDVGQDKDLMQ